MVKGFLNRHKVAPFDDKRQISDEDKIALFSAVSRKCERCGLDLKNYRKAQYHHKQLYSAGGKTKKDNIMVLCRDCHELIHGRRKIESPSEKELVENGEE